MVDEADYLVVVRSGTGWFVGSRCTESGYELNNDRNEETHVHEKPAFISVVVA